MHRYLILSLLLVSVTARASDSHSAHVSAYAGEEGREVKALSSADIDELRRGGGWGLARVAELNGVPGPVHLLEMKDEIDLDPGQVREVNRVYERMRSEAVVHGEQLIALELELEKHFRARTITDEILGELVDSIAKVYGRLRYVHLAAHLEMSGIVSADQIERYNTLRGYVTPGSCDDIPTGHDPDMWRKHHGCD